MFEAGHFRFRHRALALAVLLAACAVVLAPAPAARAGNWTWSVGGEVLTPYRNGSDPYAAGQHRGLDIAAAAGTPVRAATGGKVTYAGRLPDSGNCVTIAASDGRHLVSYLHLQSVAVKRGANIGGGAAIGEVGTTGTRSATAPHLHFSVRLAAGGVYVDPLPLLGPPPSAHVPVNQNKPVAKPQAAQPPAAVQPPQSHGNAGADSGDARGERGSIHDRSQRRFTRQRSGTRTSRPRDRAADQVHAPPPGDTVATAPAFAAAGSAREGHASRGRVAPPPLSPSDARPQRLTDSAVTGEDVHDGTIEQAAVPPGSSDRGGLPWKLFALVAGASLAIALLWRRRGAGNDTGPLEDDGVVVIERPATDETSAVEAAAIGLRVVGS